MREEAIMCFRPAAVDGVDRNPIELGECPTCGMPVAANLGTNQGTCPYCGNAIPPGTPYDVTTPDSGNYRII